MKIVPYLLAIIVVACAKPQNLVQYQQEAPQPYNYQYNVDSAPTRTHFGHTESGDPVGRVTGNYYVLLPDGRLMTVEYFVNGESGFVPKISFQQNANLFQG